MTGAAGGLGRAFALGFADRGYRVAVADLDTDGAKETARLAQNAGADAWHGRVDVTDTRSTEELAARVAEFETAGSTSWSTTRPSTALSPAHRSRTSTPRNGTS